VVNCLYVQSLVAAFSAGKAIVEESSAQAAVAEARSSKRPMAVARPRRGGALGIYSPLVHAFVWSQVVPVLPMSPSYVHSALAVYQQPPPAGVAPVSLG